MKLARKSAVTPQLMMPAIVDVVLLLLIFFVLCGRVGVPTAVPLEMPKSRTAEDMQEKKPLTVTVAADEAMYLEGQDVNLQQLNDELQGLFSQRGTRRERTVYIEVDRRTPYRGYVAVVDAVNHVQGYVELKVLK